MGKLVITYQIMPDGVDTDLKQMLDDIRGKLPSEIELQDSREEPVAFGLVALKVMFMMEETAGLSDQLDDVISNIDHVQSSDVADMTLL